MENQERSERVSFQVAKPVRGQFISDTPVIGEGSKGGETFEWRMYKFIDAVDRREKVFFASTGLHEQLTPHFPLTDKTFTINKAIVKDDNGNIVEKNGRVSTNFELTVDNEITAEDVGMESAV